jgi:hypothetical protein
MMSVRRPRDAPVPGVANLAMTTPYFFSLPNHTDPACPRSGEIQLAFRQRQLEIGKGPHAGQEHRHTLRWLGRHARTHANRRDIGQLREVLLEIVHDDRRNRLAGSLQLIARIVLSSNGGDQPVWRRDGAEVLFVEPDGHLQSVNVQWTREGTPTFGLPTQLKVPPVGFGHWSTQYDVSADGVRIYGLRRNEDPAPREIHVVIGWRALLD